GPKQSFVRLSNRRWVWAKAIVPTATARNPTNPEIQSGFLRVAWELDGVSPHLSGMPICGGELDGVSPHLSGMPICGGELDGVSPPPEWDANLWWGEAPPSLWQPR